MPEIQEDTESPPGDRIRISLSPPVAQSGDPIEFTVAGIPTELSGESATVEIWGIDSIASMCFVQTSGVIDSHGSMAGTFDLSVTSETMLEVRRIRAAPNREWSVDEAFSPALCLLDGDLLDASGEALAERRDLIRADQEARFKKPLGDSLQLGASEFKVMCVIERLLMKNNLRVPGVQIFGLTASNPGLGETELLNGLIKAFEWRSRMSPEWWAQRATVNRPWTALVMPSVWAGSIEEARDIGQAERDRVLHLLALNRGASGQPIATVVEPVDSLSGGDTGIWPEEAPYGGNLIGGIISGESPHDLVIQYAGVATDPLLDLVAQIYAEAIADRSPDASYFRLWSALEALAISRVQSGSPVLRLDGTTWPGGVDSSHAAPRVYELLKGHIAGGQFAESVFAGPAVDLYIAVRSWHARRNATAHYGAFRARDARQVGASWYQWALRTTSTPDVIRPPTTWLGALAETVHIVIKREILEVGRAAL